MKLYSPNPASLRKLLLIVFAVSFNLSFAQTSDLLMFYNTGYYSSMGGTGLAAVQYASSMDINPAELSVYSSMNISLSQGATYYGYNLLRISSVVGGDTFEWNKSIYNFDHISIVVPVNDFSFGIGLYRKLSPRIYNKKRAVTFSDLFTQETTGNIYSVTAGMSYKLIDEILLGVSISKYFGRLESKITGDNHGNDADKWASMENKMNGANFKCGLLFVQNDWSSGLTFESPFNLKAETTKQISSVQLYKYLLPGYEDADWKQPMVFGAGVSYYGLRDFLIEADYEHRKYENSDFQVNLYEFGGDPVWENLNIFRFGVQYKPDEWTFPVKIGYAYIPQLYYSNNSTGISNTITSYQNADRTVKHTYTIGSSVNLDKLFLDFSVDYSIIKWKRTLLIPQTISDDFTQKEFTFSIAASYSFR